MSVLFDLLQAAKNRVDVAVAERATVVLRKRARFLQTDTLPLVIVCPGEAETIVFETFANDAQDIVYGYQVNVVFIWSDDRVNEITDELSNLLQVREDVRNACYTPLLPDITTAVDVNMSLVAPYANDDAKSVLDVSAIQLTYQIAETRTPS